ncbi:non-homologous end joining protein Ku [Desulfopila inferna]|uniref:non-homologous end joining protein Ku n=1 Tax=Desulfopila inferna TaxID=468528 RepID=UPI0019667909|nr:Ku protein [Desulfopila inferna]MBM9603705.1 Ku protein [Desulfopila inferna]
MPRAIWKGGISFGLVYIPVKLYSGASRHDVDLKMLRKGDQCPIKYTRVCQEDGKEVSWNDIIKGHRIDDYYVTLTDEDFKRASLGKSDSIDIQEFVKTEEINPRYFEKPYLLEPEKGAGKTYNLLRKAIRESKMAGLAKFVMRNREHLALLMADEKVLYLIQMRFHDELRPPDDLKIPDAAPSREEQDMAIRIIESMSTSFQPEKFKDSYQQNIREIIKAKSENREISTEQVEAQESAVQDLMEQLKKSLEKAG